MELFIFLTVAAVAVNYHLASKKGASVPLWVILGVCFGFLSTIILAVIPANQAAVGNVACTHCAEMIKVEAKVCRHCGRDRA